MELTARWSSLLGGAFVRAKPESPDGDRSGVYWEARIDLVSGAVLIAITIASVTVCRSVAAGVRVVSRAAAVCVNREMRTLNPWQPTVRYVSIERLACIFGDFVYFLLMIFELGDEGC